MRLRIRGSLEAPRPLALSTQGGASRASATRTPLSPAGAALRASIQQRAGQRIWPRSSSLTVTSSPLLSSSTRAQPFSIPAEPRSRPPTSLMRPDACTSPSTKTEAPTSYRCSALNAISFPCVLRPLPQRMTLPCRFRLDVRDAARASKQQRRSRPGRVLCLAAADRAMREEHLMSSGSVGASYCSP